MAVFAMIIIIYFIPPIQEHFHWLKHVGISVIVAKFDIDYGIDISVPQDPDEYFIPCIQTVNILTYLSLWSYESLVDEEFAVHSCWG